MPGRTWQPGRQESVILPTCVTWRNWPQAEEQRGQGSPEVVLRWFGERLAAASAAKSDTPDEERLRLESDARLVRVATIHRSKGLEYEIVFCPVRVAGWAARAAAPGGLLP